MDNSKQTTLHEVQEMHEFGPYQNLEKIGQGGMGIVYKAYDTERKEVVAIKTLQDIEHASEEERLRFDREARAMAQLQHPHIVQMYDIGEVSGHPYFAMEFVEGSSLQTAIKQSRLTINEAVEIMAQVCDAVHYAHKQGIIHRDLKPANIMLTKEKQAKIMDFGLAKVSALKDGKMQAFTKTGTVMGTIEYMPPEQAEGKHRAVDERSDVYALGATLYDLLTGHPPFTGDSSVRILYQILHSDPRPPHKIKDVPQALETICMKALEKRRSDRYASAKAMGDDLHRFLHKRNILAKPAPILRRIFKMFRYNKIKIIVGLLSLLVLSLGFVLGSGYMKTRNLELARKYLNQGVSYEHSNDYSRAIELYHKAIELNPNLFEAYTQLGFVYSQKKEYDKALSIYNKGIEINPNLDINYYNIGNIYLERKNYDKAIALYNKAIELNPKNYRAYNNLGTIYDIKKEKDKAIACYEKVLMMNPDDDKIYQIIRYFYSLQGEYDKMIAVYDKAIEANPKAYLAYYYAGVIYHEEKKDYGKAIAYFEKTLSIRPKHSPAYAHLAGVYNEQRNYDKAVAAAEKSIKLTPDSSFSHKELGKTYMGLGEYDKAIAELNKALELNHKAVEVYCYLGEAFMGQKDYDKAIAAYKDAIERRQKFYKVYYGLACAYKAKGDFDNAIETYRKILKISHPPQLSPQIRAEINQLERIIQKQKK